MKKKLETGNAPAAIGPYSQAVSADGLVFVSGQLPINPETGEFPSDDVSEQTYQSLNNIREILKEAGYGMENVLKTTVFLQDMNDFAAMNAVYETFFTDPYPARAAFQVAKLPKGAKVEIEAVAK
ncbi:RidA family protein [Mediterraneibacter glycyrrhizinilyticus]|uniref:RidA family protein n=1 Tax=Mediterraneibacter glycyrrhizinilyticus TaxID=342942 RepID=UPI0025A3AFA0|nr:RidA family protein [Mediterraneibacter glycyrrhizinilyticus]MDM8126755.1 RidA family protein [Mediterraneibacter glycyrrhizinilyticus]MDM8209606.1 RidA family protein [Mediterraneibacter glycyrrhizinilyticus]